nr:pyridoxal-dependent decarboxylase [Bradyrhizobium tropiciagri]
MGAPGDYCDPGLGTDLPEDGIGARQALDALAPLVLAGASRLGADTTFAHMDPPTPWVTWAAALWNVSLNQNLLHPATAPVARDIEQRVIAWLAPYFGMSGGHMTSGSTLANITALWAARERTRITEVVAGEGAHLSIAKAAHLLGLRYRTLPSTASGAINADVPIGDLRDAALVLTAGTTSTGAIDPLDLAGRAAWTHVDAAWAGPLRLTTAFADRLQGLERADSVAVSAHKWLFQPKEAGLIFFRDVEASHAAISFGGAYLAAPNIGIQGSHGAAAVPLLATLMAWGRSGLASRIEYCVALAARLAEFIAGNEKLELRGQPETGVVVWRPRSPVDTLEFHARLPNGFASVTFLDNTPWLRNVAANPNADIDRLADAINGALGSTG